MRSCSPSTQDASPVVVRATDAVEFGAGQHACLGSLGEVSITVAPQRKLCGVGERHRHVPNASPNAAVTSVERDTLRCSSAVTQRQRMILMSPRYARSRSRRLASQRGRKSRLAGAAPAAARRPLGAVTAGCTPVVVSSTAAASEAQSADRNRRFKDRPTTWYDARPPTENGFGSTRSRILSGSRTFEMKRM